MTTVSATCAECGTLYRSSPIKAEAHRSNAVTKASKTAVAHSEIHENHVVMIDPGDPLEEPRS